MNKTKLISIIFILIVLIYLFVSVKSYYQIENSIQTYEHNEEALNRVCSLKTIQDIYHKLGINIPDKNIAAYYHELDKDFSDKKNNKYVITNKITPFNKDIYLKTGKKVAIQNTLIDKYKGYAGGIYVLVKSNRTLFLENFHS